MTVRRGEHGMSISMAILALTIISIIMLYVGTQTLNTIWAARKKADNSVGMAAGDSAIEKYRSALVGHLADETTGYLLDKPALDKLIDGQENIEVIENASTSDAARMQPVRVPASARWTVVEHGTDTISYWQLYDVIPPRYGATPSDLVVYIRAWATGSRSGQVTTKPRVFRVTYRPNYFSDYQSVTDAPFFAKDNVAWTIGGPIHSNGYSTVDWLALDNSNATRTGVWIDNPVNCTAAAKFSTSQNAGVVVPGGSCATAVSNAKRKARQISLLGVHDTIAYIDSRCGRPGVYCVSGSGPYSVRLGNNQVKVNGASYAPRDDADARSLTLLFDDDVTLHGALDMSASGKVGRVTVATRRVNATDVQPQVFLAGDAGSTVGVANSRRTRDSVGVITQGDVVLLGRPNCMRDVNLAAISESGAITLSPEFVTLAPPSVNLSNLECASTTVFYGSFSSHGQFLPSIKWPDVRTGGWTGTVGYSRPWLAYNTNLFRNPPPFFPTTAPWGVTRAKDANNACLIGTGAGDPRCE